MAKDYSRYLASTTPGLTWSLSVFKNQRKQVMAYAIEGKRTQGEGYNGFEFMMAQSRKYGFVLPALRLTDKVQREGMALLISKMLAEGLAVAPDASL